MRNSHFAGTRAPGDTSIRLATSADADRIAESLALAFEDDPVMALLFPEAGSRGRRLIRFFRTALLVQHLDRGACFTDVDVAAAALWNPPGQWHLTAGRLLRGSLGFLTAFGRNLPVALRALAAVEGAHPHAPHYYLAVLGTRPDRQGTGLGSSLLHPVLERCDHDGLGAYLESSKERNIPFYRRHGFEVTGEIRLPGGPLVWPMWRDPR